MRALARAVEELHGVALGQWLPAIDVVAIRDGSQVLDVMIRPVTLDAPVAAEDVRAWAQTQLAAAGREYADVQVTLTEKPPPSPIGLERSGGSSAAAPSGGARRCIVICQCLDPVTAPGATG